MPLDREDAILNVRQLGYIDTQINPHQGEEAQAISLRQLNARYHDRLTPKEVRTEYQVGVDERLAQVSRGETQFNVVPLEVTQGEENELEFGEEREVPEIKPVTVSGWQQEFGAEYRTAVGESNGQFYSGVEISEGGGDSDIEWGKAHNTRQAAEKELAERVNSFTDAAGVREKEYQDSQMATFESPQSPAKQTWLEQEASRIHEAAEIAVPASELDLAAAYWNGRRESYNSARDFAIQNNPDIAKDLPEGIQIDQVRVRALQVEQEVALSASR